MSGYRLRTQLVIAAVAVISALSIATLLILRQTVHSEIQRQVTEGVGASTRAFQAVERERAIELSRTASLLSELPPLKALMTTAHAPTIQDASDTFWKLAGSDLFVLADPAANVLGLHVRAAGWDQASTERDLKSSLETGEQTTWWFANGQLYRVFIQSISAGAGESAKQLGILAVGYEIDSGVAEQLALVSRSQIVLAAANRVIASTLSSAETERFQKELGRADLTGDNSVEWNSGTSDFEAASVSIPAGASQSLHCFVLVPLAQAKAFQTRVNRAILILGIAAVVLAAAILGFVSSSITRPLENLVLGVRALAKGDYSYAIKPQGSNEIAELSGAFAAMRTELLAANERRIANERIAAVRRAASSISHDLRHYLAAVVANAEFLAEGETERKDRVEIYDDIKTASEQMTNLIDSLRELAREDGAISPEPARLDQVVQRAVDAVLAKPEFREKTVPISATGEMDGVFDAKKIERVFFNLVLNACEATAENGGAVRVQLTSANGSFTARVEDTGPGIPAEIRDHIFDPFVSHGKVNGTGLGLAIVQKIVHDHRGTVGAADTRECGAAFEVALPRTVSPSAGSATPAAN